MRLPLRRLLAASVAALPSLATLAAAALAQSYPAHTVTIVVPFAAAADALGEPAMRKRLEDLAQEIPPRDQLTPEALGALQKAETEKWWPIIKAANIKVE